MIVYKLLKEIGKICKVANSNKFKNSNLSRNRALLAILISTGCPLKYLVLIKKKDLISINDYYRIEFKNDETEKTIFIGFLNPKAKSILDEFLNSKENLDSDDFIFDLTISAVEQFLVKVTFYAKIKMNVFGTNQNMKINQRIQKRLFNIFEKNNISKQIVRYLKPSRESGYYGITMSKEKLELIFRNYQKVSKQVTGLKTGIAL